MKNKTSLIRVARRVWESIGPDVIDAVGDDIESWAESILDCGRLEEEVQTMDEVDAVIELRNCTWQRQIDFMVAYAV